MKHEAGEYPPISERELYEVILIFPTKIQQRHATFVLQTTSSSEGNKGILQ